MALSSCEAKYIVASMSACQAMWLEALLKELSFEGTKPMRLLVDNKSTIDLAKHPIAHGRSNHIEIRFHFLRDQVNKDKLELANCRLEEQVVDVLTKPLKVAKFEEPRDKLGMFSLANLN